MSSHIDVGLLAVEAHQASPTEATEHVATEWELWHDLTGPSVAETAGSRQDSGLQFVGDIQELRHSCGFKPMYPYPFDFRLSLTAVRQNWRTHQIPGELVQQSTKTPRDIAPDCPHLCRRFP